MRADPKMHAEFCEECNTEMEHDIDYEGRGVSTCPKCPQVVEAHTLIGDEGAFRIPGGRTVYEAVMLDLATARNLNKVRLARLATDGGRLRQINRYVDWDAPIEVLS
jgi:hypothetical protein